MKARNTTLEEMTQCVARFAELRGSEEAFVDSRLPGCRRKINIIGHGVVERTDLPELLPNIPLPAHAALGTPLANCCTTGRPTGPAGLSRRCYQPAQGLQARSRSQRRVPLLRGRPIRSLPPSSGPSLRPEATRS